MHPQNTTPVGTPQVFSRREYDWLNIVTNKFRGDNGREVRNQHNVSPRLVAALADEISRYPSFKEHSELWGGRI